MKIYLRLLFLIIVTTVLFACAQASNTMQEAATEGKSVTNANGMKLKVQDGLGKQFVFDKKLDRVVGIASQVPSYMYAMQGKDAARVLVNMAAYGGKKVKTGWAAELMPEFKDLKLTAASGDRFSPNVEEILQDRPELVIQWHYNPKLIEPMERAGLSVFAWPCCTLEQNYETYSMAAYVSGEIGRSQQMILNYRNENDALQAMFAKLAEPERVSVLEVDKIKDGLRVVANGYTKYHQLGMKNLAKDDTGEWWRTINIEQLLLWNPEVIIVPAYARDLHPEHFYQDPLLSELKAIEDKSVYKAPKHFNGAPEAFLVPTWVATVTHGADRVKFDKPLKQRFLDAYQYIYDKQLSKSQLENVLQMEQNKDSKGYTDLF